jgi:hypothetical protein
MIPPYAPAADSPQPQGGQNATSFDDHLSQLDALFQQNKAMQRTMAGRDAMRVATAPPPQAVAPTPQQIQGQQALMGGVQALQQKEQMISSALTAATQNLDPIQKAALALKLQQNASAAAVGQAMSGYLEMPLDPRSALLSAAYGGGGTNLGDPYGGAARILSSIGPQVGLPRSTLDMYHQIQANRPHKVVVHITQNPPSQETKGAKT